MQFGVPSRFCIQCVHEPISNDRRSVFGRMAISAGGKTLGDYEEPACMLNVTGGILTSLLGRLQTLEAPEFDALGDAELHGFLEHKLYADDESSADQVAADAAKYFKYNFLTNGGESFDQFQSFIYTSSGQVRILLSGGSGITESALVEAGYFVEVVSAFLNWLAAEASSGTYRAN